MDRRTEESSIPVSPGSPVTAYESDRSVDIPNPPAGAESLRQGKRERQKKALSQQQNQASEPASARR